MSLPEKSMKPDADCLPPTRKAGRMVQGMTAIDVLNDARDSLLYNMELTEQLEVYRTIAERAQRRGYADAVMEVVDRGAELKEEISTMIERSKKAETLIETLENAKYKCLLRLVYLCGLSIREAAEKMNYTVRWTYMMHRDAIGELERRCEA